MSLEMDAMKTQPVPPASRPRRPPTLWEMVARFVALLLLWGALSVVFWIPFGLLGPIAASVVLAGLTLLAVNLLSRVIGLGHRVRALEEQALAARPGEPQK